MPWKHLIHQGVTMPPKCNSKGYVVFKSKKFPLKKDVEEYLVYWSQLPEKSRNDVVVLKNFISCIQKLQPNVTTQIINDKKVQEQLKKNSFSKICKVSNEVCIDGKIIQVNNTIERPSIFIGRGNHPLRGMIKSRVKYEDITVNWSGNSKGPMNKPWRKVLCDKNATWIACWKDTLLNKTKYIHMNALDNKNKFTEAQMLKGEINRIMNKVSNDMMSDKESKRQMAVVVYIIYTTGIRVGHEKDENTSDSVGCCTLNVENLKLKSNNVIDMSFNGKDYIPFQKKVKVTPRCYSILSNLINNKNKTEQIFSVSASRVNEYLGKLMPNLTAKVFRTYRASNIFCDRIRGKTGIEELKEAFNEVAKFCNHKKTYKGVYVTEVGTCKKNYVDPRIVYSYCKRCSLNIADVYSPELQRVHGWASLTSKNFVY